jgi:hypothetical protein
MKLRIDHIAVELAAEARAEDAEQTLRTALALLANRLATTPFADEGPRRALDLVELGPVAPGYLAGPGAAARIADDLYREIARARG